MNSDNYNIGSRGHETGVQRQSSPLEDKDKDKAFDTLFPEEIRQRFKPQIIDNSQRSLLLEQQAEDLQSHLNSLPQGAIEFVLDNDAALETLSDTIPGEQNDSDVLLEQDDRFLYIQVKNSDAEPLQDRFGDRLASAAGERYRIPLHPQMRPTAMLVGENPVGITLQGQLLGGDMPRFFGNDPQSGWQYANNPMASLMRIISANQGSELLGFAADGFPIYSAYGTQDPHDPDSPMKLLESSYRLKSGERPSAEGGIPQGPYDGQFVQDYEYKMGLGDLDEYNGRFAVTPDYPEGIYHYVLTESFPFLPQKFRGTPDESFNLNMPPQYGR